MIDNHNQDQTTTKKDLSFLSMQVIWSLPEDTTLAEEIEKMMSITFSGIAYNIETICKTCEIIYHADDEIIEFELCFVSPKYQDCIKACADLMNCGCFPNEAECLFERNLRNEKFAAQIWHESNDRNRNRFVMPHFYDCACADTCLFTQFFFLHAFVNKELE